MELFRALAALADPPAEEHGRLAELLGLPPAPDASTHADVFLMQLPPDASVYVGGEGMLGGEALDRVAGFWRALRQEPPDEPDHLSSLLGLAANLAGAEARESDVASARLLRNTRAALALGASSSVDASLPPASRGGGRAVLWFLGHLAPGGA